MISAKAISLIALLKSFDAFTTYFGLVMYPGFFFEVNPIFSFANEVPNALLFVVPVFPIMFYGCSLVEKFLLSKAKNEGERKIIAFVFKLCLYVCALQIVLVVVNNVLKLATCEVLVQSELQLR